MRTDPNWEQWNFAQLSEAIRLWTRRNPVDPNRPDRERAFIESISRNKLQRNKKQQVAAKLPTSLSENKS